jgi:hypothetical protein
MAFKRDYLRTNERMELCTMKYMQLHSMMIWEAWQNNNFITEEEKKLMEITIESARDFVQSVRDRINKKDNDMIAKKMQSFDIRYVDRYTIEQLNRDVAKKTEFAKIPMEQWLKWCEEMISIKCKNCQTHCDSCELYDAFDDNFVPEFDGWNLPNCKYAYKEE